MELVSKKVLTILSALFFLFLTAAVHPLTFHVNHITPWNVFPKNFMGNWDDDSFFGGKFPRENLFQESFTFSEPRREESDKEVRLIFDIKGHEKGNFEVRVSEGQLTVVGKDVQKSQQGESHWSQAQSFPIPEDADPKSYAIERNNETLTIVFKKWRAST